MARSKKNKKRIFLVTLFCLSVNAGIFCYVGSTLKQVYEKKMEEKEYSNEYNELLEEEEKLKSEVLKLQDPSYVAKYAREKFLYSKDNEYIVKIRED